MLPASPYSWPFGKNPATEGLHDVGDDEWNQAIGEALLEYDGPAPLETAGVAGEPDLALVADAAVNSSVPPLARPRGVCATLLSQRQLVRADSPFHLRMRVAAMPLLQTKRLPPPSPKKRRIEGVLA